MSKHNNENDSFKHKNLKKKIATITGMTLFITLIMGFILGIYFFGFAGVFELLGVQYQSNWSLAIFVVSFFILGFFVDLIFSAMAKRSVEKISGKGTAFIVQLLFEFVSNWLVLLTVDAFMGSISLTPKSKLIIALLVAILESAFDNKREENEQFD